MNYDMGGLHEPAKLSYSRLQIHTHIYTYIGRALLGAPALMATGYVFST